MDCPTTSSTHFSKCSSLGYGETKIDFKNVLQNLERDFFLPLREKVTNYILNLFTKVSTQDIKTRKEIVAIRNRADDCWFIVSYLLVEYYELLSSGKQVPQDLLSRILSHLYKLICLERVVISDPHGSFLFKKSIFFDLKQALAEQLVALQEDLENPHFFKVADPDLPKNVLCFWNEKNEWKLLGSIEKGKPNVFCVSEEGECRSLFLNENCEIVLEPAISIGFFIRPNDHNTMIALQNACARDYRLDLTKIELNVFATYYFHPPKKEGVNCFLCESKIVNKTFDEKEVKFVWSKKISFDPQELSSYQNFSKRVKDYSISGINCFKEEALNFFASDLTGTASYEILLEFPKSHKEQEELLLEVLKIAKENPEENAKLITYLAEKRNLTFTLEELEQAHKEIESTQKILIDENMDADIPAATVAQVMINQLEKQINKEDHLKIQIPDSTKSSPPSKDELEIKNEEKKIRKKKYQEKLKEMKQHKAKLNQNEEKSKREPLDLKSEQQKDMHKLLKDHKCLSQQRFAKLVFSILKNKTNKSGISLTQYNSRGSHPTIHVKSKKGSSGATLWEFHTDCNGKFLAASQRRTILDILDESFST